MISGEFLEIGTDKDRVHFLLQLFLTYSVTKAVTMIKSLASREVFKRYPQVKKQRWEEHCGLVDIIPSQLASMGMKP